jgi:hypothetical protein
VSVADEKHILQNSIDMVCKRLGFDDNNVKWFIYNADDPPKKDISLLDLLGLNNKYLKSVFSEEHQSKSYYLDIFKKEIYISNKSILVSSIKQLTSKLEGFVSNYENNKLSLIDTLIIDAITRLQTGEREDNENFKNKLNENLSKFC